MLKKRILLADDDADDRSFFEQILRRTPGVELLASVEDGMEVMEFLETSNGRGLPDLIILDHNMPRLNGKQTLGMLKSSDKYAHIFVVIYSTYIDQKMAGDCTRMGASMVASKPAGYDEYEAMINSFLGIIEH